MTLKALFAAAALSLTAVSALAQAPAEGPPAPPAAAPAPPAAPFTPIRPSGDIAQTLRASGQFATFMKLVDIAGLTPLLARPQPLTVFAPNDAAFAALSPGELSALMQPGATAQLQQRLLFHIYNDALDWSALQGKAGPIQTGAGPIYVDGASNPPTVNGGPLLQTDLKASNGNVYVIGKVIGPGYTPPAP